VVRLEALMSREQLVDLVAVPAGTLTVLRGRRGKGTLAAMDSPDRPPDEVEGVAALEELVRTERMALLETAELVLSGLLAQGLFLRAAVGLDIGAVLLLLEVAAGAAMECLTQMEPTELQTQVEVAGVLDHLQQPCMQAATAAQAL
jgi:hypothetical protein